MGIIFYCCEFGFAVFSQVGFQEVKLTDEILLLNRPGLEGDLFAFRRSQILGKIFSFSSTLALPEYFFGMRSELN